jgi:hypothetical protein
MTPEHRLLRQQKKVIEERKKEINTEKRYM